MTLNVKLRGRSGLSSDARAARTDRKQKQSYAPEHRYSCKTPASGTENSGAFPVSNSAANSTLR